MTKSRLVFLTVLVAIVILTGLAVAVRRSKTTTTLDTHPLAINTATQYEKCVDCETGTGPCLEHGGGRYAQLMLILGPKPWVCCPAGYVSKLTSDNKVVCVYQPPPKP